MRYLVFTTSPDLVISELVTLNAYNIIPRLHTDCTEIDFQMESFDRIFPLLPGSFGINCFLVILPEKNELKTKPQYDSTDLMEGMVNWLNKNERFWEVHEVLEELWHSSDGKLKEYYHGLTLVAVANVQAQTSRQAIAEGTYTRAMEKIASSGFGNELLPSLPKKFSYPTIFRFHIPDMK